MTPYGLFILGVLTLGGVWVGMVWVFTGFEGFGVCGVCKDEKFSKE